MEQDTSPQQLRRYHRLLGSKSPAQRLKKAAALSVAVRQLAEAGIRARHPEVLPEEVRARLAIRLYGRSAAKRLVSEVSTMPNDPLDPLSVALAVADVFDRLGVPYFLGGSLASSLQGEPRATNDINFVVDMTGTQAMALEAQLGPHFDVDTEALCEAVARRSSWNIYHLPSMTKVDLFIRREGPFDANEFARRAEVEIRPGQRLMIKSPEDTVLRKLLWFREGGAVSTTQWRDVVEVLRVSAPVLNQSYLDQWASLIGVADLLVRARSEARIDEQ